MVFWSIYVYFPNLSGVLPIGGETSHGLLFYYHFYLLLRHADPLEPGPPGPFLGPPGVPVRLNRSGSTTSQL